MLRPVDLILIAVMAGAATLTYKVKHAAEEQLAEVKRLRAEIQFQKNTIDLIKADWALLNQPARLQRLVRVFGDDLGLQTTTADQMVTLDDLPGRRVPSSSQADSARPDNAGFWVEDAQAPAARADDTLKTGSVVR